MTVELDSLVVSLRADTRQFRRDIAQAREALSDLQSLAEAPQRAAADSLRDLLDTSGLVTTATRESVEGLERLLARFAETGRLSFRQLRAEALAALSDIADAVLRLPPIGIGSGGGLGDIVSNSISSLLGRAAGGPVTPDQPFLVGERGPEVFVPRIAGEVLPNRPGESRLAARPVAITVNVNAAQSREEAQRSGTQVALALRRALGRAERFS